ncbi:MAG TPA: glycolate oxidase subunit GlcE [Nitrosospira sp.]|nr:glycolate oxidase subunit GlcE [Nitrosospira sp.]
MHPAIDEFSRAIRMSAENRIPLLIRGGGSKDFYGNLDSVTSGAGGSALETSAYSGTVDYEPTELVITVRAGTRLADLERELSGCRQMLAFEPPHFSSNATIGGCVAAGLSGPRRASAGSVRDFVLGVRMLDGKGEDMSFGGQVMKNVAGYDISRLMAGSMGTLGLLLEISLKVMPMPVRELTLRMEMDEAKAIEKMNSWAAKPLPISASCFHGGELTCRLSGAESAVRVARDKLGGEEVIEGAAFWESVREQMHPFFRSGMPLWRLSVKPTTRPLSLPGKQLMEWGGALRWLASESDAPVIRAAAEKAGGHATLFRRNGCRHQAGAFHPLPPAMLKIHRRLREQFDPFRIFNPVRMYAEI